MKALLESFLNRTMQKPFFLRNLKKIQKEELNDEFQFTVNNLRYKYRLTALAFLCVQQVFEGEERLELIRVFLQKEIDINAGVRPPIFVAAQSGRFDVVNLFLAVPDINVDKVCGISRISALTAAAVSGHAGIIGLLLKVNARIDNPESILSPLSAAMQKGMDIAFGMLVGHIKKFPGSCSKSQLYQDFRRSRESEQFQKYRATLESLIFPLSNDEAKELLAASVRANDSHFLFKILDTRIDANLLLDIPDGNGRVCKESLLHLLAQAGEAEIVGRLIRQYGANPFTINDLGQEPFMYAVFNRRLSVMRVMLETHQEVINHASQDNMKIRPLHAAARMGELPIVQFLLDQGAGHSLEDAASHTPFHNVLLESHAHLIPPFKNHGIDLNNPLSLGSDPNSQYRPIFFAIALENTNLLDKLCEEGASPAFNPGDIITPLNLAIRLLKVDHVKTLLTRGEMPYPEVLHKALHFKCPSTEVYEIIEIIVNHPQFNAKDFHTQFGNPLSHAISTDDGTLANILLDHFDLMDIDDNPLLVAVTLNRTEVLKIFFNYILKKEEIFRQADELIKAGIKFLETGNQHESARNVSVLYQEFQRILKREISTAGNVVSSPQAFFKEEPSRDAYSSRAYRKLVFSDELISVLNEEMRLRKKKATPVITQSSNTSIEEFKWFDGAMHSSAITTIEKATVPSYLWLAENLLQNQKCDLKFFIRPRYVMDNKSVKALKGSKYTREFEINGKHNLLIATHELKPLNRSKDRILLFQVKSDDTSAMLYIGAVFKEGGFHEAKDKSSLLSDLGERLSILKINLPEMHSKIYNAPTKK